jgi:two-component system, OmpR family, sensor histidine kinase CreC
MKITWRILLAFLVFSSAGFYFLVHWMLRDLRPRYMEAVEETLVDTSRLLAAQLEADVNNGKIPTENLQKAFAEAYRQNFSAQIYDLNKTRVNLKVYVTDAKGIVIFDSRGLDEGKDFSHWNDVFKTLKGQYGARSTRTDPNDPGTSMMYVAAPIRLSGKIFGVVTAAKPAESIRLFLINARLKILFTALPVFLAVLAMTLVVSLWITRPIKRLTDYAKAVGEGKRVALPALGNNEMGDMGRAFEEMRVALEGKKYVEQYVQLLTHEIKGPLSAIRGAAELLEGKMPTEQRKKFLENIRSENARIQEIVDRLLLLSTLENRKTLEKAEEIDTKKMMAEVLASFKSAGLSKKIAFINNIPEDLQLIGDPFLLRQALANLVQNAFEFSPAGDCIQISAEKVDSTVEIRVEDNGPGVPSFALDKVFEKFYSLQRPDTGRKSSGLGLCLVKEVASLHGGEAHLENRSTGGARAILKLPLHPSIGI